ncbi:MAG: sulfite exporter TauE/SafE family protein [Candidatus Gottesmanbacteria bacterium]|nr:sulfite exporter TauE/SafE family protein [Candidatus Gottesmanbacteria bacterium]
MNTVWLAFLTGLTTGGISCLAVQGGLLASSVSQTTEAGLIEGSQKKSVSFGVIGMFLGAKLVAHVILGFLLGMLGSTLVLSPMVMGFVQIVAGLFMLATAARIIDLHPIFRYAVITPPRWAYRLLRGISRDESSFAPLALGFFTIFMPCGITQATMLVAVASGSPWLGAGIMGAFVLGTSPVFVLLGTAVLTLLKRKIFTYVASGIVALFALVSISGGVGLTGSFFTIGTLYRAATMSVDELALARQGVVAGVASDGMQQVVMNVRSNGYSADATTLKVGVPVRLRLIADNAQSCARAFTIPGLGISKILPVNGQEEIVFTPQKSGPLTFACSMGMYTGSFNVIP